MKICSLFPSKFKRIHQFNCSRKEMWKSKKKRNNFIRRQKHCGNTAKSIMTNQKCQNTLLFFLFCYNMSFPFADTNISQENKERERIIGFLYHFHPFTKIQTDVWSFCVRDSYLTSLISALITRSLLNEIYPGRRMSICFNVRYYKFLTYKWYI